MFWAHPPPWPGAVRLSIEAVPRAAGQTWAWTPAEISHVWLIRLCPRCPEKLGPSPARHYMLIPELSANRGEAQSRPEYVAGLGCVTTLHWESLRPEPRPTVLVGEAVCGAIVEMETRMPRRGPGTDCGSTTPFSPNP